MAAILSLSSLALLIQVLAQFVVGFAMAIFYSPTLSGAYASEAYIRANGAGAFAASFHYWGSALLIVHSALHLGALLLDNVYRRWIVVWYSSLALFLLALGLQVTGNLLPMDRHGVQTAVVESGIAGSTPLIGSTARHIFLSGDQFGQSTLSAWMATHSWLLAPLALLATILLYYNTRRQYSEVRDRASASSWPAAMPILLLAILAITIPAPHGNKAGPDDFTSYGALVSWYTWPVHGMLSAAAKINPSLGWLGSMLWPVLTLAFFVCLPFVAKRLTRTTVGALSIIFLLPFVVCPVLFGGPIASLVGNRDPAQPLATTTQPTTKPSTRPDAATLLAGRDLFNSVGCSGCHGKNGANGDSGPDLTKEYQKHSDPTFFQKYVQNPKSVDPASTMPPFPNLTEDQLSKLSAWLSTSPSSTN